MIEDIALTRELKKKNKRAVLGTKIGTIGDPKNRVAITAKTTDSNKVSQERITTEKMLSQDLAQIIRAVLDSLIPLKKFSQLKKKLKRGKYESTLIK